MNWVDWIIGRRENDFGYTV